MGTVTTMKTLSKLICAALCMCLSVVILASCSLQNEKKPDFSGIKEVAKLSTLECYYHNVVKYHRDPDGFIFNFGEKNLWFEYDGIVEMGLDINKVTVSEPDTNGVVTITIPNIEVLGHPDIDTASMSTPIEHNGWFTSLNADDKKQAMADAQANLLETAQNDTQSKSHAMERAKNLLERYVKNTGEALGATYTVKWTQAEKS